MNKILILALVMTCNISSIFAQTSAIFTVYVEDSQGRIDSIKIGQDDSATVGVDASFGEVDISGTPLNPLDIRIIQRDSIQYNCLREDHWSSAISPAIYFSQNIDMKKDFRPIDGSNQWHNETNTFEINLHAQDYPIVIRQNRLANNITNPWFIVDLFLLDTACVLTDIESCLPNSVVNDPDTFFTILDSSVKTLVLQYQVLLPTTKIKNGTSHWKIMSNPVYTDLGLVSEVGFDGVIDIFSSTGKQIYSEKIQNRTQVDINISQLSTGIYFVRYADGRTVSSKPFVKE